MRRVVIVAAKRTPIGRNMGVFADIKGPALASVALAGTLNSIKFPAKDVSLRPQTIRWKKSFWVTWWEQAWDSIQPSRQL